MKIEMRYIVAAALLLFAWKGHLTTLEWPTVATKDAVLPSPPPEAMQWAADVRAIVPKMLPSDRLYLRDFYDSMSFILVRDKARGDAAIMQTTEDFAEFHGGSLDAAIDKAKVGKYPGLDKAIDAVFFKALGTDDPRKLTPAERDQLVVACGVLASTFGIGSDG